MLAAESKGPHPPPGTAVFENPYRNPVALPGTSDGRPSIVGCKPPHLGSNQ